MDPVENRQRASHILKKSVWALIALFAPDIVLSLALHQFLIAWEYRRAVNNPSRIHTHKFKVLQRVMGMWKICRAVNDPSGTHPHKFKVLRWLVGMWKLFRTVNDPSGTHPYKFKVMRRLEGMWILCTRKRKDRAGETRKVMKLKMAFFAIMGGFRCEDSTANDTLWKCLDVKTLCSRRTMDIIRDYSLSEVKDKSKAGAIAKAVACFQAGWLLLQCLGRHLEGIHITLLELNTVVHVILAIIMYIIWWEKPYDIGRSIAVDRSRLGTENSATMIYADKVRYCLGSVEKEVFVKPPNSDDKEHETSGGDAYHKIRAAVTIFRNFGEVPGDAGRIFKIAPHTIRRFFQHVIRKDTKHAVLQNYKKHVEIPVATTLAAYEAAFAAANETAFRIAREQMNSDECKQAAKGIADYRILEKTVCTRLATEKIVCTGCGITTEKTVCTSCGLPTEKIACTNCGLTTEKIICTSCGQTADAKHVGKNIIDPYGRKNFEKALEKVYITTRKNTFKDAFNASFAATAASLLENTNTNSSPDPTSPTPPNCSELQKNVLISAFRAANAAARAPSRHAVRLVAYDWALGKEGALNAATAALRNVTMENVSQDIKNGLDLVTEKELNKALEKHFCSGAPRIGTDFGPTFAIVKKSTASVISTVAFRAIQEAKEQAADQKDQKAMKVCESVENVLSAIMPIKPETKWKRLRSCLIKAFEVVGEEVISVPELFEPPTGRNKKGQVDNVSQPSEEAQEKESRIGAVGSVEKEKGNEIRVIESVEQEKGSEIKVVESVEQEKGSEIRVIESEKPPRAATENKNDRTASNAEGVGVFGPKWRKLHRTTLLVFSIIAGAFYGGAHSTKWNSQWFPTEAERLLWRISCVVGSAAVIPIAIQLFYPFVLKHTRRIWPNWCTERAQPVQPTLPAHASAWSRLPLPVQIVCSVCWAFFIAARVYIVVESFLSVRSLPREAFRAVSWTNAIPHI